MRDAFSASQHCRLVRELNYLITKFAVSPCGFVFLFFAAVFALSMGLLWDITILQEQRQSSAN